ncbi:glucomannan 4-beta-mannosyltransferase 9 [Quercus suber]|uniref:Glucomannan 4-beta-mannosyltransferase 9 n=1 Tax=Quercus suber TaxID=58331 RepID=A0AAW0LCT4_QUESU
MFLILGTGTVVLKLQYLLHFLNMLCNKYSIRLHLLELGVGAYLFFCGCYDLNFGKNRYFIYLFLQSFAFFIAGVGYVGTFVPNS